MKPSSLGLIVFALSFVVLSTSHAQREICEGLFKAGKFIILQNEKGRPQRIEGREGDEVMGTYEIQPHANRGLSRLWTGGVHRGEFPFENNFLPPAKFPGWGYVEQKYKGDPDKIRAIFFATPETLEKKSEPSVTDEASVSPEAQS